MALDIAMRIQLNKPGGLPQSQFPSGSDPLAAGAGPLIQRCCKTGIYLVPKQQPFKDLGLAEVSSRYQMDIFSVGATRWVAQE